LYEMAEVAGVAQEVLKRNKVRNCHLMPCASTEMVDPPRADVVISETLGNYAFEENIIETMKDAQARHLKPGGVMIPQRVRQFVAPVVAPHFDSELRAWSELTGDLGLDLDFAFAGAMSLNNVYVRRIGVDDLLDAGASAVCWDDVDLTRKPSSNRKGEARFSARNAVTVHGLAVWWEAQLTADVGLSTAPGAPATHWEQLFFPLLEPLSLAPGEALDVALSSRSSHEAGTHLAWKVRLNNAKGTTLARQALDLDKGFLP
ncbi:MAG: ribonucleotide-diphosphate reductase subunit beta, partial [Hyphomicrobiaceae bacterium]